MGKKFERCVKKVKAKIQKGKIPKAYKCGRKICKSDAYALCKHLEKK